MRMLIGLLEKTDIQANKKCSLKELDILFKSLLCKAEERLRHRSPNHKKVDTEKKGGIYSQPH